MIAAIYGRKSTEQDGVSDEDQSVPRQLSLGKEFAAARGWEVFNTYADYGISGRETDKLTGRAQMFADASAGKFQVVIVRDLDRLSRDDYEGAGFVYMLRDVGVTVWEYSKGAPIETARAMDRTMLSMRFGFAAQESEGRAGEPMSRSGRRRSGARWRMGSCSGA